MRVDLPNDKIQQQQFQCYKISDLEKLFRCTRQHIYNQMQAGEFPKGFKLGSRRLWSVDSIRKYLRDKEAK